MKLFQIWASHLVGDGEFFSIFSSGGQNGEMKWNDLNNFGRVPPKGHLCEIISKLDEGFRKRYHFSQLLTDNRWTTMNEDKGRQNTKTHFR